MLSSKSYPKPRGSPVFMRDKQEKNNQIADPPLLNAIKKGKAKQNETNRTKQKQNKTLALARKERAKSKHRKQKERGKADYAC